MTNTKERFPLENITLKLHIRCIDGCNGVRATGPFSLSMTVRDNIRFAKPHLEQAAVEQAAALAFINQEIKAFPEGYDTMVGERGVSLSGGQNNGFLLHGP